MSMNRQIFLMIILISLLALVGSVVASTYSTRAYLIEQLGIKNQDNASALAVSLSQTVKDQKALELTLAAQFDSGSYQLIRFTDEMGLVVIEKTASDEVGGVPSWFIKAMPIQVPVGQAKISQGWKQLGTVTLASQSRYAYESLWRNAVSMAMMMTIVASVGILLSTIILRRIKRPLDAVVSQANAISEKRFVVIPEPDVPELKKLASAMNQSVTRLKELFDDEAKRLEAVRQDVNYDQLTSVAARIYFLDQLSTIMSEDGAHYTACFILRIEDIQKVNQLYGRFSGDEVIKRVANIANLYVNQSQDGLVGRLNGSDFAILTSVESPMEFAESMMKEIVIGIGEFCPNHHCASIGLAFITEGLNLEGLLSQMDLALAEAETQGPNAVRAYEVPHVRNGFLPKTPEASAQLVRQAIANREIQLIPYPVVNFSGHLLHLEGFLQVRELGESNWISAARFFSIAERYGLSTELDLAAVSIGLAKLNEDPSLPGYAINISGSSLIDGAFVPALTQLLRDNMAVAKKLWLEIPEGAVFKHDASFRELCLSLEKFELKLGIQRAGKQIYQMASLHDLGVSFIKVDAAYARNLDQNAGNQVFLKGLSEIAHQIGLLVIAEGVTTREEIEALKLAGFDGATGPVVNIDKDVLDMNSKNYYITNKT